MIFVEYVIKRDGSQVLYNKDKIYEAINAANEECILKEEGHLTLESLYDALEDIDSRCNNHVSDDSRRYKLYSALQDNQDKGKIIFQGHTGPGHAVPYHSSNTRSHIPNKKRTC